MDNLKVNKMDNTILSFVSSNTEFIESLKAACIDATEKSGDNSFSRLTQAITQVMRLEVKPHLSSSKNTSSTRSYQPKDNTWRSMQKSQFSGRGRQWIYVSLEDINPVLDNLAANGHDVSNYRNITNDAGKAWVRYSGARTHPENGCLAAFEIRYQGSKVPQADMLYMISHESAMNISDDDRLEDGKTPHQLGLEDNTTNTTKNQVSSKPKKNKKTSNKDTTLEDLAASLSHDAPDPEDAIEFPESLDPAEWEEFLLNEGLAVDPEEDIE
jgi:hypothetical protein